MTFKQWEALVPDVIRQDTLWKVEAYRLSLFLGDIAWEDVTSLLRDRRTTDIADRLSRSVARISACIAEGYSRNCGKARSTFYEYACGSARESRDWYFKGRRLLKPQVVEHRMDLCAQISRLTLRMISTERSRNRRVCPDN